MSLARFCIDRPIFAGVISILIVIIGAVSYFALPVAQYPEIAPPTIQVKANYPGASADIVADTVATPLEQEINGVENMLYMSSQSTSDGALTLTVTFELGTNLDDAQVLVQNRVAIAEPRLPEEVRSRGVTTQKNSPDMMMIIHILSPDESRDQLYISNYAKTQIVDRLNRINGVGSTTIFGERAYSMRVWLDPERIASFGLTAGEVVSALQQNNVQVASGAINQPPGASTGAFELNVETQGRLVAPEQFAEIVIRTSDDGSQIRVRDLARVELGAESYRLNGYLDGKVALPIAVFQQPGSNALTTATAVKSLIAELAEGFPPGMEYRIVYDTTAFIQESVDAVFQTLIEAVILVVVVILIFLQSIRVTIIPVVAIPVSLIGTYAAMAAFGFSLNNLSLFGLVLAIGIVVDDAIVVVENVERYLEKGMSPREATRKTMDEVSGALVATSMVMMAVFIPAAFLEGITGQFFRQFAVTIAVATGISTVVSLTLSPALAAMLMRPKSDAPPAGALGKLWHLVTTPGRIFAMGFNWVFDRLIGGYAGVVKSLTRVVLIVLVVYGGLVYLAVDRFGATPTGFIPDQDQGYLITVVQLPAGASLDRTDATIRKAEKTLLAIDGIDHTATFAGLDGATFTMAPNAGAIFAILKPFEERTGNPEMTSGALLRQGFGALQSIPEASIFILQPPPVRGVGTGGGWKLYIQDQRGRGLRQLEAATIDAMIAANQVEGLQGVFSLFNTKTPKIYADIDRVKAEQIGVPPERLFEALEVYLGSAFVNDFNFLGRTFRVTAQADAPYRDQIGDIGKLRARSDSGEMVPLSAVMRLSDTTGPYRVARYNLFPAAALQGGTAPGVSTGQAIQSVEALLDDTLPEGYGYEWTELALQEKLAGSSAIYVFIMAVVFVFLLLAAQYESWLLPLAVILIVPMCLLAAITGVILRGMDNNILTQIGLVVLVGLAAKNAILIVEFARQAEDRGLTRAEAAVEAARLRMRPILMTSLAFVLGVVPLLIATGAGAEMRQALGTAVFFGMLGVTGFGLLFTPVFYVVCRWLAFGDRKISDEPAPERTG